MKKRKKLLRIVFGRTTFVVLFLLIQVAVLLWEFRGWKIIRSISMAS